MKYFALAVLFLVVAGVIAYDRWNAGTGDPLAESRGADDDRLQAEVNPGGEAPESLSMPSRPGEPASSSPDAPPHEHATDPAPPADSPGSIALPPITPIEREDIALPPATREEPSATGPRADERAPRADRPKPVTGTNAPKDSVRPAPSRTKPAKRAIRSTDTIHTVHPGETLEKIALRYYGTRSGIAWIAEANNLRDANRIYARQSLLIPARDDSLVRRTAKINTKKRTIPRTYTVKKADGDLYAICRRFYGRRGEGARVARIMELNKLWSADVKAGTVLILPQR